jgi:hypothetical protein
MGANQTKKEIKAFSNGFSLFFVVFPGAVSVVVVVFVAEIVVTVVNFVGSAL